ncbi:MAG TPA: UDP-glucose 4-epimerase GalE [Steroidobacteraceae bacterium]|nr:UDP-glucose 4-epimerase GalE [Steroidobacteraceae bacterium]
MVVADLMPAQTARGRGIEARCVLVTGGAGYIGAHACKALRARGYLPVAYDNLVYGHPEFVRWGPFEKGELTDVDRLRAALRTHRPVAVMHFAGFAYVGESVTDPAKYYANNVGGTLALLDAMLSESVLSLVFSSTCAVYGTPDSVPIAENTVRRPVNPYGRSKLMVEQILEDYSGAHGLRSIALRYFNAAGADPAGEVGEDHSPETHLIPLVLDVALGRRENVTVFGNDYDTPDGTCVRDYVHVTDLAQAHVAAVERLESGTGHTAYNLGSGHGYSVLEVVDAARRVTGRPIPMVSGPRRAGDPARLVSMAGRAQADLGWRPQRSDLDTILADAWRWHRQRFGRG